MNSSRFSSFSLRSRMLAASAVLAALVIGVFVALILAISALQAATKQEARSKEVTASALMLEKLVLDVETGVRGYALTGKQDLPQAVSRCAPGAAKRISTSFEELSLARAEAAAAARTS